ncbi:protogenin B-like isoform X3 [Portunus trituberculatus]|uniref:protogenin B-like isoform X3 n=1 Tax=Portunus trituberculatus TaxID=210409 RepID=UPI001E1CB4DC|nr:protogenin B-like isoform X3 [Portunus trituberculatus]
MRIPLVLRWWLLGAAAALSTCLTSPALANFLQVPELNSLGLGFEVLPPMCTITMKEQNTTIPCKPIQTEHGVANVTWVRKSDIVNDARRYVLPNGSLFISNVEEDDREIYRCILTAGNYSVTSAFAYLLFAGTGVWQIKPRNNTVEEGRAVRLTCYMASLPLASYIWLKNDAPLPINKTRYYQPKPGVLQITNVQFQDQGMFRCKAINDMLEEEFLSSGGYLTVVPRRNDEGHPFQHSLLAVPSKVEVHEGEEAVLECITDDEEPDLHWTRIDETPIAKNRTIRKGQGSLVFPSVSEQDTGVYNCTAVSKKSKEPTSTQMIELTMMTPPKVQLSMTVSKRPAPLNTNVSNGETVRITCATWGTPAPSISWYKNGILHVESGRHKYTNKNLTKTFNSEDLFIGIIMSPDTGLYQCVTRNRAGVASDAFILNIPMVENLPLPPVNVSVVALTPYSVNVSWTASPDNNVSGYIINIISDKHVVESQYLTNKTSAVVENKLLPGNTYVFYIRSFLINDGLKKGLFSEASNYATVKMKEDAHHANKISMPVVNLYPKSPTELYANWTLVECKNKCAIIEQNIQWKKKRKHYHLEKYLLPNVTEYTINDLQPNKSYKVRVLVSTRSGYPLHMIQLPWYTIRMPPSSSDLPQDNVFLIVHLSTCSQRPTEVLVNWTLDVSLQKDLASYNVLYNTSTSVWQKKLPTTETSVTLTDLAPRTCYGVKVRAVYGTGQNTTDSHLKTICTLPQPPYILSQHSNTNKIKVKKLRTKVLNTTSVRITWKHTPQKIMVDFYTIRVENVESNPESQTEPPEDKQDEVKELHLKITGRAARSPQLTKFEDSQDMDNEVKLYRVTNRKLTVTNLKRDHNYKVSVTASTTTLTGHSAIAYVTPDEGVPTAPLNVTWVPASPKDAILTWNPPRLINGRLVHYLVKFSHDQQEWRNQTVPPDSTTTQIQDLVSNTNYTVHIAGKTGKGVGASTTVYIYIRATLEREPHRNTELAVISVVSFLVVVTCVVAVLLCLRILHLRNNSPSVFQDDGTSEGMEPLRDGLNHHRMLDTLDDIDDADDGSKRLLQTVSTTQAVFSKNMKEFNLRSMYNSTQVDHHSSPDGAGVALAVSS